MKNAISKYRNIGNPKIQKYGNMSDITDFINSDLYPQLFRVVDRAFPEMSFQPYRGGWASPKKLNLQTASDGRRDKSVITQRKPNRVIEQGGESKDLISLYMEHNNLSLIEAVKQLCSIVGIELPQMENSGDWKAYKEKQDKLEEITKRMKAALWNQEGAAVFAYLNNDRGYSDEFIKWAEFGFIRQEELSELRPLFAYTNRDGQEIGLPSGVGSYYTLAIPYRSGGRVMGFVFRTISKEVKPKYKDAFISGTASKRYHLFGLTGLNLTGNGERDKDITIVEGEIDALRATFAGVENVVAASGGNISPEALREAKRRGVIRVTLLFDYDETPEARAANNAKIKKAIDTIHAEGLTPFVATFPSPDGGKVDADEYLKHHSGTELQEIIQWAEPSSLWRFRQITADAIERQGGDGEECTFKNLDEYKRQTIALCNEPQTKPTDREFIFKEFSDRTGNYISRETLKEEADLLKIAQDANRQKQETTALAAEALRLANDGKAEEALALMQRQAPDLQSISKETEYSSLLLLRTADEERQRFRERPAGIRTGYAFSTKDGEAEEFLLPTGALTYICAPTSHGKSRMLENLALRLATDGTEGDVVYFTYEEDETAVKEQLLNIYANMLLSANNLRSIGSYYTKRSEEFFRRDVDVKEFERKEAAFLSLLSSGKLRVISKDYDSTALIGAIKYLHRNRKIKAVFVDYVQLLNKSGSRLQRKDELKQICKELMDVSKETQLPIVLAAQLNRQAFSPTEMAAQNVAEASDIEQSANVVMLLWNSIVKPLPESKNYYGKTNKDGEQTFTPDAQRIEAKGFHIGQGGKIYAILAKYRGGARNMEAVFDFNGNTGAIAPNYKEPQPQQTSFPFGSQTAQQKQEYPFMPPADEDSDPF